MRVGSLLSKPSLQAAETDLWENATQYINQERLKYAVYLLAQTDREILDICECCGFSNVSHFYSSVPGAVWSVTGEIQEDGVIGDELEEAEQKFYLRDHRCGQAILL